MQNVTEAATFTEVLSLNARLHPSRTALRRKRDGKWENISWKRFHRWTLDFAAGLICLGAEKGDSICILSANRLEWAVSDFAIIAASARTAAIYASNPPRDAAYIVSHSDAKLLIVENGEQLHKALQTLHLMPNLRKIIAFDPPPDFSHEKLIPFNEVCSLGMNAPDNVKRELENRIASASPGDVITIIYTSGTTGPPKGAMLTHENFLFICRSCSSLGIASSRDSTISYLPLAHALERVVFYLCVYNAASVSFARSFYTLADDIRELKPTLLAGVPRVFEKMYDRIMETAHAAPPWKKTLFEFAVRTGAKAARLANDGKPIPIPLRASRLLFHLLVYGKIRQSAGGKIRFFFSGGAPLSPEIIEFFHAVSLPILEAYGMTESTAPATFNRPGRARFGYVGQQIPDVELKIAPDGEILIRGKGVFKGYFKDPGATAETVRNGWLHTGDIGEMSPDGYLRVTDRKKDLIITAGGKNVAPQNIENLFKTSRYISNIVVIGDRQPYLTALITLSRDEIEAFARERGIQPERDKPLESHPEIIRLLDSVVTEKNSSLPRHETIKKYKILPGDFSEESGELTPTLKVKRRVICSRFATEIEELYRRP
ncbi:MAG: long-chain fatty acid--CoA ligase [bacterium]